jgi:integrase
MARVAAPWFWEERQGWYVNKDGQRHFLGEHPADAPPPHKHKKKWNAPPAIMRKFHDLMAQEGPAAAAPKSAPTPDGLTVAEVCDKYLDFLEKRVSDGSKAQRTYDWSHNHIQDFLNRKPDAARLPALELRPFHVVEWADSHGEAWGNAYRRGGIGAIQRAFNWAEELGYIPASPIKKIPKPQPQRREQAVSPDMWPKIRDQYAEGDPFRDLLEFAWETGCRPQEAKRIEPRHVELDHHRVVFPAAEAKGKRYTRVIWMNDRAEAILRRRMAGIEEGVIFRNEDGHPWTAQAMACRFGRLEKHLGEKFCAYALRHGFATRKLLEGHDHLTVAEVMGHRDGRMLAQHYSHLDQHGEHLRRVLEERGSRSQGNSR